MRFKAAAPADQCDGSAAGMTGYWWKEFIMQNEHARETNVAEQDAKKPYARPELVKHGNVESTTQGIWKGPSSPWYAN
jgi:hypothetical protein